MSVVMYSHDGTPLSIIGRRVTVFCSGGVRALETDAGIAAVDDDHKRLDNGALVLCSDAELLPVLHIANEVVAQLEQAIAAVRTSHFDVGGDHVGEDVRRAANDTRGLVVRQFGELQSRLFMLAHHLGLLARSGGAA